MTFDASTLFAVHLFSALPLSLVSVFVVRSFTNPAPAYLWAISAVLSAMSVACGLLRGIANPLLPILVGNGLSLLATCVFWIGVRRFLGDRFPVALGCLIMSVAIAGLALFSFWRDDLTARIIIYSTSQGALLALLGLDLMHTAQRRSLGMWLVSGTALTLAAVLIAHSTGTYLGIGGVLCLALFNGVQSSPLPAGIFGITSLYLGVVLLAVDQLHKQLMDQAYNDDLTELANRRQFQRRLETEWAHAARSHTPFALLAIDLDDFKSINDTLGHATGDACLIHFAKLARAELRTNDLIARTGGDEFCIILPNTDGDHAEAAADLLVDAVRQSPCAVQAGDVQMTISVGIAIWSLDTASPAELLALADQALYLSKGSGRNGYTLPDVAGTLASKEIQVRDQQAAGRAA